MALLQELLEPWAITPDAFQVLLEQSKALMARDATPVEDTINVTMRGDVAVMHVKGPLFRYRSWITQYLGTSSYGELRKDFQKCIDGDYCKAILFVVDSPGGEVNGCAELAEAIYAARGKKPMAVYVSGTGASAAYFLTSAVGTIYCAKTALLGSIGVITTLTDYSKAMTDAGVKEYQLVSTQSPKKAQDPADAAYRGRVQQRIDDLASVFVQSVGTYRGVSTATVLKQYGQGDALVGQSAVDAGLADGISDVESVIASLQSKVSQSKQTAIMFPQPPGAYKMDVQTMARRLGLEETASEKQVEEHALALSHFHRDVLVASGAKTAEEAIGKIRAGLVAIGERDVLTAALKAQEQKATQKEFRSELKAALKEGRITMGELATVIPTFMKDEERDKALAALKDVKSQDRKELLDAVCAGQIGDKRMSSVRAFLTARQSNAVVPAPARQPADNDENAQQQVTQAIPATEAQLKEFRAKYGMAPPSADLVRAETVDEYLAAKQKTAASTSK